MTPAATGDTLRDYFDHVALGQSMREIARRQNCPPSTVMRRVNRAEALREDPDLDDALDILEAHHLQDPWGPWGMDRVLKALDTDREDLNAWMITIRAAAACLGSVCVSRPGLDNAVILRPDLDDVVVPRRIILAARWANRLPAPSPDGCYDVGPPPDVLGLLSWCISRNPALFDDDAEHIARAALVAHGQHGIEFFQAHLPGLHVEALNCLFGGARGFKELDHALGVPHRSAKVLIASALSFLSLKGVFGKRAT